MLAGFHKNSFSPFLRQMRFINYSSPENFNSGLPCLSRGNEYDYFCLAVVNTNFVSGKNRTAVLQKFDINSGPQ